MYIKRVETCTSYRQNLQRQTAFPFHQIKHPTFSAAVAVWDIGRRGFALVNWWIDMLLSELTEDQMLLLDMSRKSCAKETVEPAIDLGFTNLTIDPVMVARA